MDEASILLDRPPGGWNDLATRRDLDALEARIDRRFVELDAKFDAMLDAKLANAFAAQTWRLVTAFIASLGVFGGVIIAAIKL